MREAIVLSDHGLTNNKHKFYSDMNESKKEGFNPIWIAVILVLFIIVMYLKTFTDPNKEWQMNNEGDVHLIDNTNGLSLQKLAFILIPLLFIIYLVRSRIKNR